MYFSPPHIYVSVNVRNMFIKLKGQDLEENE